MSKLSLGKLALVLCVALGSAGSAMAATTIDFEATPTGTYSSLTYGAVTISFLDGSGTFDVANTTPGPPISGHNLLSYFTNPGAGSFQATFAGGASSVSIGMGDFNADDDEGHLRAYDAANNLLDIDSIFVAAPTFGGGTMTVSSSTAIARVEWNETGSIAGAVYWDNLTYEVAAVPEPATYALMALGLAFTGFVARRRRAAK
jgi:PEP-CTERM motif-containing protein